MSDVDDSTAASSDASTEAATTASSTGEIKEHMQNTKGNDNGTHKSIWAMTRETFGMADGGKAKASSIVDTEAQALQAIKAKVAAAKEKDKKTNKWEFLVTPTTELNATLDDVLLAFCKWTKKDSDDNKMNIGKAFRRLTAYVNWMNDAKEDLEEPLTVASIQAAAKAFGMKMTHDSSGRLVWWFDVANMDVEAIHEKTIPVKDVVRYFVWATHVCLLDASAQANGMLFIQDTGDLGFWELMTLFPPQVSAKMDRLTIGVLPVQMKGIYVVHAARWMKLLMSLIKPFMSKKMRQRVVAIGKKEDAFLILTKVVGGKEYIPTKCCDLEGTLETDIIFGTWIKE
jgi:hypothetical protein